MIRLLSFPFLILISAHFFLAAPVDVAINTNETFQTIEGLGQCLPLREMLRVRQDGFIKSVPEAYSDSLINQLGLNIVRVSMWCEFQEEPGVFKITDDMRKHWELVQIMKNKADESDEPFKVVVNVFSPPPWMKLNKHCSYMEGDNKTAGGPGSNSLDPDNYDAFGEHVAQYLKFVKDTFGIDVYAVSPQNEPGFDEPYASCKYDATSYKEMLKKFGPHIRNLGYGTLIFGSEHMAWMRLGWERVVMNDEIASKYLDRFAVHGFTDGIQIDTSWTQYMNAEHAPLWISEFGCKPDKEPMSYARTLMRGLIKSNLSVFILCGGCGPFLTSNWGGFVPHYYLLTHFYRFIRPGMVRVGAAHSDDDLLVGVFKNYHTGAMSVVAMNIGSEDKQISLKSNSELPTQFDMYVTSTTDTLVPKGMIASSNPITVPAHGIVSLGHKYKAQGTVDVISPQTRHTIRRNAAMQSKEVRIYDLRGRYIGSTNSRRLQTAKRMNNIDWKGYGAGIYIVKDDVSENARIIQNSTVK